MRQAQEVAELVDVVRASTAAVPALPADVEHDTRNVVLTLARVWSTRSSCTCVPGTTRSGGATS